MGLSFPGLKEKFCKILFKINFKPMCHSFPIYGFCWLYIFFFFPSFLSAARIFLILLAFFQPWTYYMNETTYYINLEVNLYLINDHFSPWFNFKTHSHRTHNISNNSYHCWFDWLHSRLSFLSKNLPSLLIIRWKSADRFFDHRRGYTVDSLLVQNLP